MYEPFPVESSLHEQLTDHLNAEIVAKTIRQEIQEIPKMALVLRVVIIF